jgi:hypothetical protein
MGGKRKRPPRSLLMAVIYVEALSRRPSREPKSRSEARDLSRTKGNGSMLFTWSRYLCRRRPTLPHTFACSTIGPAGLNFRVRDGNGCFPCGKITGFVDVGTCRTTRFQAWVARRTRYVDPVKNFLRGSWEPQILRRPEGLLRMTNLFARWTLA